MHANHRTATQRALHLALLSAALVACQHNVVGASAQGAVIANCPDSFAPAALKSYLDRAEVDGFSGAVALATPTTSVLWASSGYDPSQTKFWIASISKPVTATAAVRLAQAGRLDLNTTVGELFPEVPEEVQRLTLKEILAHRSGLGGDYAADAVPNRADAVRAITAKGLEHEGFFYSNKGYNLAAAMIERATGEPFEKVVRDQIFKPLGMSNSGFWGEHIDAGQFARLPPGTISGVVEDGQTVRNYGYLGSTGIYSSAADMLKFLKAVQSPEFLSDASQRLLWTPGWAPHSAGQPRSGQSYGLGWGLLVEKDSVVKIRHGGWETHLHNGEVAIVSGELSLVVLSDKALDRDTTWSDRISDALLNCASDE